MHASAAVRTSVGFVGLAILCIVFADIQITTQDPWTEMGRLGLGILTPDFAAVERLGDALIKTVAFAFLGVFFGRPGSNQPPLE